VTDPRTQQIFQFFRDLGYSGVLLLGNRYLHYANPDAVSHYKFRMEGHRDFLFFPPEAIGTTSRLICRSSFRRPRSILWRRRCHLEGKAHRDVRKAAT
jgi:hypothetical protein